MSYQSNLAVVHSPHSQAEPAVKVSIKMGLGCDQDEAAQNVTEVLFIESNHKKVQIS